ncbi:MAG: hypothetical protein RIQ52_1046 [Pseudomonadota bacterium]|jgi:hypothetical protein
MAVDLMNSSSQRPIICIFILAAIASLVFFVANRPRILIIQSEQADSYRSRQFKDGWLHQANASHFIARNLWFFLDQDVTPDAMTKTVAAIRSIEREDPDLVVLVDDQANARLAPYLPGNDRMKILYVGIDQNPEYYGYGPDYRIAGIDEQLRVDPIHELMSLLRPGEELRYGVIGVDNPGGHARLEQIRGCAWNQHHLEASALVKDFEAWKSFIERHQDLDILIILNFDSLKAGDGSDSMVPEKQLIFWTEDNSRPLPISVESKYVRYGGGLAFEASPRRFGEMALSQSAALLKATPGQSIPPIHMNEFAVAICLSRLASRGLAVPAIYQETARLAGTLYP